MLLPGTFTGRSPESSSYGRTHRPPSQTQTSNGMLRHTHRGNPAAPKAASPPAAVSGMRSGGRRQQEPLTPGSNTDCHRHSPGLQFNSLAKTQKNSLLTNWPVLQAFSKSDILTLVWISGRQDCETTSCAC